MKRSRTVAFYENYVNIVNKRIALKYMEKNDPYTIFVVGSGMITMESLKNDVLTKTMNLRCCGIEDSDCIAISEYINNNNIINVDLTNNNIGDKGCRYLANALKNNSTLTKFHISGNNFGVRMCEYLIKVMRSNSVIIDISIDTHKINTNLINKLSLFLNINKNTRNSAVKFFIACNIMRKRENSKIIKSPHTISRNPPISPLAYLPKHISLIIYKFMFLPHLKDYK